MSQLSGFAADPPPLWPPYQPLLDPDDDALLALSAAASHASPFPANQSSRASPFPANQSPASGLELGLSAKSSPGSSSSSSKRGSQQLDDVSEGRLLKRQRNNIAAKKYRQKKVDRIQELEEEVAKIKEERDELRIRLAREEAKTTMLEGFLSSRDKKGPAPESD
jgi:hypothetical protein